jgi:hypothetical protein
MNWDGNVDFTVDMAEEEGFASDFAKWDESGCSGAAEELANAVKNALSLTQRIKANRGKRLAAAA